MSDEGHGGWPPIAFALLGATAVPGAHAGATGTITPIPAAPISCAGGPLGLPASNGGHDLPAELDRIELPPGAVATCRRYAIACPAVDDQAFYTATLRPQSNPRGTILSLAGLRGTGFNTENVEEYLAANFRVVLIAYAARDNVTGWQCAESDCPEYGSDPAHEPGPREAACRPATIIEYFKQVYDPNAVRGYCAQGHSAGSSQLAYAMAHYGSDQHLDYVQMTAWTPYARPDCGCAPDPERGCGDAGLRGYAGVNPDGTPQAVFDRPVYYTAASSPTEPTIVGLMRDSFGLREEDICGGPTDFSVSAAALARLGAQAIVSEGANYTYPGTIIDAYACDDAGSIVDGNGAWYFERISAANPQRVFMQTIYRSQGECRGEVVWWRAWPNRTVPSPIRQLMIDRMIAQCVKR